MLRPPSAVPLVLTAPEVAAIAQQLAVLPAATHASSALRAS